MITKLHERMSALRKDVERLEESLAQAADIIRDFDTGFRDNPDYAGSHFQESAQRFLDDYSGLD